MTLTRFLLFSGRTGNVRPFIVYLCLGIFTGLLTLAIMEIIVLLLGVADIAPPLGVIEVLLKLKTQAVKLIHDAQ